MARTTMNFSTRILLDVVLEEQEGQCTGTGRAPPLELLRQTVLIVLRLALRLKARLVSIGPWLVRRVA